MKKFTALLLAALFSSAAVCAQDLIVRTDSSRIEARVTEISPETVRYKRASNPDGPTYVVPAGDVAYIRYANGETDRFAPAAQQPAVTAQQPAPAAQQPRGGQAEEPLRRYDVGDYYRRGDVEGIVAFTTDDGLHGLIVGLHERYLHWSEFRKPDLREVGATDPKDGLANMARVEAYIAEQGLSWSDFPAFAWCREQGEGWYLPAIDELLSVCNGYHGGMRNVGSRQARNAFNDMLKSHGGDRMDRMVYYFSSTETDEKSAYTSHMGLEPPFVVEIPKYNKFLVRAVHRF